MKHIILAIFYLVCASDLISGPLCNTDNFSFDNGECLSRSNSSVASSAPDIQLDYEITTNQNIFEFNKSICISKSIQDSQKREIVIVLDRSSTMAKVDGAHAGKLDGSSGSIANKLVHFFYNNGKPLARVGLLVPSSDADCQEFRGKKPEGYGTCLFIPPLELTDPQDILTIETLIHFSETLYAKSGGGSEGASMVDQVKRYFPVADDGAQNIVWLTNGRGFSGVVDLQGNRSSFPELQTDSFLSANERLKQKISDPDFKRGLVIGLLPLRGMYETDTWKYRSFCSTLSDQSTKSKYCANGVNLDDPGTWPVNKYETASELEKAILLNPTATVGMIALDSAEGSAKLAKASLDKFPADLLAIKDAFYSVNGSPIQKAEVSNGKLTIQKLPVEETVNIFLQLKADSEIIDVPITIHSKKSENRDSITECATSGPNSEKRLENMPKKSDLRGGSASCGAIGQSNNKTNAIQNYRAIAALILITPLLLLVGNAKYLFLVVTLVLGYPSDETLANGLSAMVYRPAIHGIGPAEDANPRHYQEASAGISVDYANDLVELSVDGKRTKVLVDDTVTLTGYGEIGLFNNVSTALSLPYVYKSDVTTASDPGGFSSSEINQPADGMFLVKYKIGSGSGFDYGIQPAVSMPIGASQRFLGDSSPSYFLLGAISSKGKTVQWNYNGGIGYRSGGKMAAEQIKPLKVDWELINRYGISGEIFPQLRAELGGQSILAVGGHQGDVSPHEWMLGARYWVSNLIDAYTSLGAGLGSGIGAPNYRALIGVNWQSSSP